MELNMASVVQTLRGSGGQGTMRKIGSCVVLSSTRGGS